MKFSIAGTGNVAHHFVTMLKEHGHTLLQVHSRDEQNASHFTQIFGGQKIASPQDFSLENELVFIAVNDDAILRTAEEIPMDLFVVHTSGMTNMNIIPHAQRGVVWPIQSLTKGKSINYSEMPLLLESSDEAGLQFLHHLFSPVIKHLFVVSSEQRAKAHLAAVFANNFVNQMYDAASGLLHESGLDFSILNPMIDEQIAKLKTMTPREAQTGPAVRGDMQTIERHLTLLNSDETLKDIYTAVTNRILQQHHDKKL